MQHRLAGIPPDAAHPRARVTINDLADALGLTKGTVSRALNGYSDISPSTRKRVEKQAQLMGYRPLSHAQAIRTGRTRSIGLVLQMGVPGTHRPFIADFLSGVSVRASAENWTLTMAMAPDEEEVLSTLIRLIEERKADGFILPRTLAHDPRIELLSRHGVPFVLFGRTRDAQQHASFDISGEDAMRGAVLRLFGLGHRRIGFVNGGREYNFSLLREEGFRAGMAAAGLDVDDALVLHDAMTTDAGARATHTLLSHVMPPTAIVFAVDMAAMGAYRAAAEAGLTIGQDLSVIAYDGIPEGAYAVPPLTTYDVDMRRAGERLADLLIRRIRGEPAKNLVEMQPARLVARGSDGPPRLGSDDIARRVRAAGTALEIPKN